MKICAVQARPFKGDIQRNIDNHKKLIDLAISQGAQMIVFPELSITGYEPALAKDLSTHKDDKCLDVFQQISDTRQVTIGVGMPLKNESGISISLLLFQPRQPRQVYSKKYLHADEEPFFVRAESSADLTATKPGIALAICYELSIPEHSANAHKDGAAIYIASVAKTAEGAEKANKTLSNIARAYSMTVLMSNSVGYSDDFKSGGKTSAWDNKGRLLAQLDDRHEGIVVIDTDNDQVIEKII